MQTAGGTRRQQTPSHVGGTSLGGCSSFSITRRCHCLRRLNIPLTQPRAYSSPFLPVRIEHGPSPRHHMRQTQLSPFCRHGHAETQLPLHFPAGRAYKAGRSPPGNREQIPTAYELAAGTNEPAHFQAGAEAHLPHSPLRKSRYHRDLSAQTMPPPILPQQHRRKMLRGDL